MPGCCDPPDAPCSYVVCAALEIVYIVLGVVLVAQFDISSQGAPEHGHSRSAGDLLLSGSIQYACELAVDFVIIVHLTVFAKEPYLDYSHLQHRYFLVTMSIIAFFASG
jgi:ethanolamine utilization microcompartment shell protein EutL